VANTINFCGDSFCADTRQFSWITLLSNKLGATVLGTGKIGSAHEHAIQTFDSRSEITIFCWTEPYRLHNTELGVGINMTSCEKFKGTAPIWDAAYNYYKYLHNNELSVKRQIRDLYWFDREVLSNYKGKLIHMWSFKKTYSFLHGVEIEFPLISLMSRSANEKHINHLDVKYNHLLADKLYKLIRS